MLKLGNVIAGTEKEKRKQLRSSKNLGGSPSFNGGFVDESLLDISGASGKEKKSFAPSPPVFSRHSSATTTPTRTTPIRAEKCRRPSVDELKVNDQLLGLVIC